MGEEVHLAKVSVLSSTIAIASMLYVVGTSGVRGIWGAMALFYGVRFALLAMHYSKLGSSKMAVLTKSSLTSSPNAVSPRNVSVVVNDDDP
eukprot:7740235-Pyramimonas_sp.AAC.2